MSVKVENLEHNMVKLTVTVPADDFSKALTQAYNRNKKNISIPGFRKGHAPQQLIEKMYGTGVFYEDAANILIPQTYPEEAESTGLEIVSRPEFDIEQIEKGKDFIYTATAAVKPAVELGAYEGIEVKKQDVTVTDEDVDAEIKKEQEKNSRLVDAEEGAAVENGDTINLDYSGSIDGVKFDGGTAEGQTLVIGSNTFIQARRRTSRSHSRLSTTQRSLLARMLSSHARSTRSRRRSFRSSTTSSHRMFPSSTRWTSTESLSSPILCPTRRRLRRTQRQMRLLTS